MNRIEVTPENVIRARINAGAGVDWSKVTLQKQEPVPLLPEFYASIYTLFSLDKPWWTDVGGESYIPRSLIELVLYRREMSTLETRSTFSSFIDGIVTTAYTRHRVSSKIISPKQRFQFWEGDLASTVLAMIEESVTDPNFKRNKIGYQIREDVSETEFTWLYQKFLVELEIAYNRKGAQDYLHRFLDTEVAVKS